MLNLKLPILTTKRLLLYSLITGVLLGLIAVAGFKISNSIEVFMSQFGLFIVVPVIFGLMAKRKLSAAFSGLIILLVMCMVYYAPYANSLVGYLGNLSVWAIISVFMGPTFGLFGYFMQKSTRWSYFATASIIGLLAGEAVRSLVRGLDQGDIKILVPSIVFDTLAVIAIIYFLKRPTYLWVLILSIPAAVVGYMVAYIILG